jgi:AhpD family alkylhydroperoxidase
MPPADSPATFAEYAAQAPGVVEALRGVGRAVEAAGLDKGLVELVKIRVSQINGCAFCLKFHLDLARKLGVGAAKLDLVAAWRDAPQFSARERAALGWAEALTRLSDHHAMVAALDEVKRHFDGAEINHLAASVAVINAWNRLGAGLGFPPPG